MTWTPELWEEATGQEEYQLVAAIRMHLLSEDHRLALFKRKATIEDLLNGRIENDPEGKFYQMFFDDWNCKLGWKAFGF
jgi:hypothetical protein